jgi:electron transfer flavoprotein beta subunit
MNGFASSKNLHHILAKRGPSTMKIFVCIKQVPDTETKIKVSGATIDTAGIKWVMNPYDEYAVEEAIKSRDKIPGAQVWVLTVAPKARGLEVLRTALAMGADEAILVDSAQELDSLATAKVLAKTIEQESGARMIFTGKLAIDDNASAVGPMMAELLHWPHASSVVKLELNGDKALAEREIEGGSREIVELTLPALIAANKGLNNPRYASLPGIMKAKKKVIKEISAESLGVELQSKTTLQAMSLPGEKPAVKVLQGDFTSQAQQLVKLLRDEAKVL